MVSFNDITVGQLRAGAADITGGEPLGDKTVIHAKVLDYGGGKALLEVNGRMVSAETDVPLKQNGEFDLIVRGQDQGGKLSLQVIGARESASSSVTQLTDKMIASRLIGFDLPDHESSVPAARSLIINGVAVTKATMEAMLAALPKGAPQNVIDFAASLIREELPISRELVALATEAAQTMEKLPADIKAASPPPPQNAEQATTDAKAATQQTAAAEPETAPAPRAADSPLPFLENVSDEDAAVIAEKLPAAVKTFLTSMESRIQAHIEAAVSFSGETDGSAKLMEQLTTMLKIIPEAAEQDESSSPLLKAASNIVQLIEDMEIDSPQAERARQNFLLEANRILNSEGGAEKLTELRDAAVKALAAAIEGASAAPPESFKPAPLFGSMFQSLYNDISSAMKMVDQFTVPQQGSAGSETVLKPDSMDILNVLARLQSFKVDGETLQTIRDFISTGAKWTASVMEEFSGRAATETLPTTADPAARAALRNELMESMKALIRNPEFAREFALLSSLARDASGPQSTIAQSAAQSPQSQGADFMRSMQLVNLANAAGHTGVEPMNYYVTFFPFRVGGHTAVGKLKIFKREGEDRNKKNQKPLNPFDATIALILDLEHLGVAGITMKTFLDKSLDCEIELEDRKRKLFVEKFADELNEGLENTAYEKSRVRVTERKRAKRAESKKANGGEPPLTSIDMRV